MGVPLGYTHAGDAPLLLPIRGRGLISISIRSAIRAKNTGSRDYYGVMLTSVEPGDSLEISMAVTW
jgi:hypothetical protein